MLDKLSVAIQSGNKEFFGWAAKILILLAMGSAFFTFKGASLGAETFSQTASATVFAVLTGIAIFALWTFVLRSVRDWETSRAKLWGLSIMVPILLVIVALSSTYNCVGIDAGGTLNHHQVLYINSLALELAGILEENKELAGTKAEIRQGDGRYRKLAEDELKGSVSGSGGQGAVYNALVSTADRLEGLVGEIEAFQTTADKTAKVARVRLDRMRAIQGSSKPFAERDRLIKTESDLLRADFAQMDSSALSGALSRAVDGLAGEVDLMSNFSGNKAVEDRQREAQQRLKAEISKTADALGGVLIKSEIKNEEFPAYEPLSPTSAVLRYWDQIIPQWSGAIAIDATPFFMVLLMMVALSSRPREEIEGEAMVESVSAAQLLRMLAVLDALREDAPSAERTKLLNGVVFRNLNGVQ